VATGCEFRRDFGNIHRAVYVCIRARVSEILDQQHVQIGVTDTGGRRRCNRGVLLVSVSEEVWRVPHAEAVGPVHAE